MNTLEQALEAKLRERQAAGNLRSLSVPGNGTDFFSNDYLGISATGLLHKLVADNILTATGSTGSRLISGNSAEFEALEATIATFHKAEAALIFNSGYDANTGLISAIADRHTTILYDELCHASIIDGIRLSLCANKYRFAHNNLDSLQEKLQQQSTKSGSVLVIVESVYSMDGDMAPLAEIVTLCKQYGAQLIVDEAHATGVFAQHGEGLVVALGLQDDVFARVHTFGKALGCHGAVVVGSQLLRNYLINFARSFIYTTALPPHSVQLIAAAYQHLASPTFSNQPLHNLIAYFRNRISESNMPGWVDSISPIQALVIGDNDKSRALASILQQQNIHVKAILHPTVPKGSERLRICLHTFNTRAEVDRLLGIVKSSLSNY